MGLDTVEFLLYAEKEFGIKITDKEAGKIYTVGEFSVLCYSKLQLQENCKIDEEQVFSKLKQTLRKHFLSPDLEISRKHLIVNDLGFGIISSKKIICIIYINILYYCKYYIYY